MPGASERVVQIVIRAKDDASAALTSIVSNINPIAIAAAAATAAVAGLAAAFYESTKAAAKQQDSDARLAVALASVGQNGKAGLAGMNAWIDGLEDATKVSDDTIRSTAALLAQFGHLSGDSLKRTTQAVLEYSAAIGTDANQAAEQFINVLVRGTGRLAGINTHFAEGATRAEKFNSVLSQMEAVGGNTAEVLGDTFSGALKSVGIHWERLLETIGAAIVENQAARDAIQALVGVLDKAGQFIEEHKAAFEAIVTIISRTAQAALEAIPKVARFVGYILTMGQIDTVVAELEALGKMFDKAGGAAGESGEQHHQLAIRIHGVKDAADDAGASIQKLTEKLGPPLPPLEALDALLDRLGATTMRDLAEKTRAVNDLLDELAAQHSSGAISDDVYDAILQEVTEIAKQLPTWSDGIGKAGDAAKKFHRELMTVGQAFQAGVIDSTLKFSDTIIDAALGAKVTWKQFFRELMADLLKAIARAAILKALESTGGWWGTAVSFAIGAATTASAGESMPVGIGPADISVAPVGGGAGLSPEGGGGFISTQPGAGPSAAGMIQMFNQIVPIRNREAEIADLIGEVNNAVERRGYRLVASHVLA